ncbi:MAG: MarR family transcriptional regulator [Tannerellaceae bacterium]|nr:MarR family transcriptional regulator [Tannerellaceae bacterium]
MDFFNKTGKMALGSRLRMLTDMITEDATKIYQLYGVDIKAKWFPVFFILSDGEPHTITSIAKEIGHSHPSASNMIREMSAKGLVKEKKDKADGRRNMV